MIVAPFLDISIWIPLSWLEHVLHGTMTMIGMRAYTANNVIMHNTFNNVSCELTKEHAKLTPDEVLDQIRLYNMIIDDCHIKQNHMQGALSNKNSTFITLSQSSSVL